MSKSLISLNFKKNRKKKNENDKNNEIGNLMNKLKSSTIQIKNMTNSILEDIPLTKSTIIPIYESNIQPNNNSQNITNQNFSNLNNINLRNSNFNYSNLFESNIFDSNLNSENLDKKKLAKSVVINPKNDIDTKIDFTLINYFQIYKKHLPVIKELTDDNLIDSKIEKINEEKEENEKLKKEIEQIKKLREEQEKQNKEEDKLLRKKKEENEKLKQKEVILFQENNENENDIFDGLLGEEYKKLIEEKNKRLEKERLEKERLEKERLEKERKEKERKEKERKEKEEKEEKEKEEKLNNNFSLIKEKKNIEIDGIELEEISGIEEINSNNSNNNNNNNKNTKFKSKSVLKKSSKELHLNSDDEEEETNKEYNLNPDDEREIEKRKQLNANILNKINKEQRDIIEKAIKDVYSFDVNHPNLSKKKNCYYIKDLDKNENPINNLIYNFKSEILSTEGKLISKQRRKNFLLKNYFEYKFIDNSFIFKYLDMNSLPHPNFMIKAFEICNLNEELPELKYNFEDEVFHKDNLIEKNLSPIGTLENYTTFVYKYSCYDNYVLMIDAIKTFSYWRKSIYDGNSFYRVFMFSLIENYILNNNLEDIEILFSELIYEKNIEFYQEKDIDIDVFLMILSAIRKYLKEKNIEKAYEIFLKAYQLKNNCFDNALIIYLRNVVYKFLPEIYEEAEKRIKNKKENFKDKMISLEAIKYFGIEPEFIIINFMIYLFNINIHLLWIDNDFIIPKCGIINLNESEYNENNGYKFPLITIGYFYSGYVPLYSKELSLNEILQKKISEQKISIKQLIFFLREKEKCQICNKTTTHIIFLQKKFIICKDCLEKHIEDISTKRVINLLKNKFIGIEYSTKPIHLEGKYYIEEDELIEFFEYKNLINILQSNLIKICFSCKQIFDSNLLINLKCSCRYCNNCLIEKANFATKNFKILNKYEKETFKKIICECGNNFNIDDANKYRKDITINDTKQAKIRMEIYIKTLCMICLAELQKFISGNNNNDNVKTENKANNDIRKETDNNKDSVKGKFESLNIRFRTIKLKKENSPGKGLYYSDIEHIMCEKCYYETCYKSNHKLEQDSDDDDVVDHNKKKQDDILFKIHCNICKKSHLMNFIQSNNRGCCNDGCFIY